MSPAIKHHLSCPQIRMEQGYMLKVHLSGLHGIKVVLSVNIPYKYLCTLRTSDFPFAAKKTTIHTLTPINTNLTILSAVTRIFILNGGYEVTSCSSMGYSQTSDLVIICPDRYLLTNIKQGAMSSQLTCISGNRDLVNCQNSTFLRYLAKSNPCKVLQLIGIYYLCRTVPASCQGFIQWQGGRGELPTNVKSSPKKADEAQTN